jgi:hypothetical protein
MCPLARECMCKTLHVQPQQRESRQGEGRVQAFDKLPAPWRPSSESAAAW